MTRKVYQSREELEMRRRLPRVAAQIGSLVKHIKDIRLKANETALPRDLVPIEKERLFRGIYEAIKDTKPEAVSDSVARRMARTIGDYFLFRRETTTPVIHELLVLAPWWVANMPGEVFAALRDIGLAHVLNGQVRPIQAVWQDLLDSPQVWMGHCTCRSSNISEDLYEEENKVYLAVGEQEQRILLDRFVNRFEALLDRHQGEIPDCDESYIRLGKRLMVFRENGLPGYHLSTLLSATYPFWEFLPVLDKYTPTWIRSLHSNRKARLLHKELAFELATLLYLGKGVLFSSMQLFDQPYCICSCPTPENGGGCVLTNWYYGAGSDASLLVSDEFFGRRIDKEGNLLSCNRFPIRAGRDCVGCGCDHGHENPRSFESVLGQAERFYHP